MDLSLGLLNIKPQMKNLTYSICLAVLCNLSTHAQNKWQFTTVAEESIFLKGDHLSNPASLLTFNSLAMNSGMRAGINYNWDNQTSIEATLGMGGTSDALTFFTKIVPVDIVGHYDILQDLNIESKSRFNIDLGIGSALTSVNNGGSPTSSFGFNENVSFGASLELPMNAQYSLSFGYRHTLFLSDINGTPDGIDQLGRFYTAVNLNLGDDPRIEEERVKLEKMRKQLNSDLESANNQILKLEKSIDESKNKYELEKAGLLDEIEALKAQTETDEPVIEEEEKEGKMNQKGYYVIIGSFPTKEAADKYAAESGSDLIISYVEALNTYRVVYSMHENLTEARTALEAAKAVVETAWIAVY
jgi:hypothetical protein